MPSEFTTADLAKSMPRYLALKRDLLDQLAGLSLADRFPSQHEIMDRTGLAYETVSRALRELVAEGYVRRERGRGTFVCRRPGDLSGTIGAWFLKGEGPSACLREAADRFVTEHPLVELRELSGEPEGFAAADVVEVTSTSFLYLASSFAPLSDEIASRAEAFFDPRALELFRVNGSLCALPVAVSPQVLYVNEDLLADRGISAPGPSSGCWSWDELLACARAVHCPEQRRFGWVSPRDLQTLAPFVWQNGGHLFDKSGARCRLNEDAAVEAIRFWTTLERMSPLSPGENGSEAKAAFLSGSTALFPYAGVIEGQLAARATFRWRAVALPASRQEATTFRYAAVATHCRSGNAAAAQALAEHLVGPRTQQALLDQGCLLPASREVLASAEPRLRPHLQAFERARPYIELATVRACVTLAACLRLLWEEACDPAVAARQLALIADSALRGPGYGLPGIEPEI